MAGTSEGERNRGLVRIAVIVPAEELEREIDERRTWVAQQARKLANATVLSAEHVAPGGTEAKPEGGP